MLRFLKGFDHRNIFSNIRFIQSYYYTKNDPKIRQISEPLGPDLFEKRKEMFEKLYLSNKNLVEIQNCRIP